MYNNGEEFVSVTVKALDDGLFLSQMSSDMSFHGGQLQRDL